MPPHVTSTECKPFADLNYTTVPLLYPILAKEQKGAFGSKDRIIEFPGGGSLFPKSPTQPERAPPGSFCSRCSNQQALALAGYFGLVFWP